MITLVIILLTCFVSYKAFNDQSFKQELLFFPYGIARSGQYYRFLSSGLIHSGWTHLIVNMYVLLTFGTQVEANFQDWFGPFGNLLYLALYFGGIVMADTGTYFKHKDHSYFRSLGASGAVSGVLFSFILVHPWSPLTFVFFPFFSFPAIVLGVLYLIYSAYAAKNVQDNINHDAHFYGAIFGIVLTIALRPQILGEFMYQMANPVFY